MKSVGALTGLTLVSRVLGLVREQVRAVLLGTGAASDAFGLAVMIPNLLRRFLAEGTVSTAFVPIFTAYLRKGDEEETRAFLSRFVTLLSVVTTVVCVLGVALTPWLIETFFGGGFGEVEGKVELTIALTRLMWPYLLLVSVGAVLKAILNTHGIFAPSGATPVLLNLCIIGCGLGLADRLPDPSYGLIGGFLLGGIVQVGFQVPFLLRWTPTRIRFDWRPRDRGVLRVLRLMVPGVFASGVWQVNIFVSQLIAAGLDGGSIASLQYSIRLQELVLGLFVVSIAQVILPTLSKQAAEGDDGAVRATLRMGMRLMLYVTIPATAALLVLGEEIVRLLFESGEFDAHSTQMTVLALQFHALALLPVAAVRITQQVFFARTDQRRPALVAVVAVAVNIALCLVLARTPLRHGGIALAGSLSAGLQALLLVVLLRRTLGAFGGRDLVWRTLRLAVAAAVMVAALAALARVWPTPQARGLLALWVAVACAGGAAVYLLGAALLGVGQLGVWLRRGRSARR
ncbi:MAG: murein biosynthesis integral membrane protein MurJ [Planctomycetota bacterium]|nr:murein biosynthesis integral membrane protein MurJ [Planctomycetota bacterium]MDP6761478.1 murein biosynthesis integral membrane protein MurJ [Planctomycetota bacterium]MDP6989440.1 murein biosynthesis integral membrane protein MurJ [Planctomycetota bacterium]